ncbi:MAG: hypothetical protein HYV14_10065 [Elusimicrobia bacterium]|nr:hypothetical protein [Elusimicrobiota bacterium]
MGPGLRLLAFLNALLVFSALGCGDEGGSCGPAPEKKEEEKAGGGMSGNKGGSSGAAELVTSDKKGRVPKPYQRPKSAYEPEKSTATISAPAIPLSPAAQRARSLPVAKVTKRALDGIKDRVEVKCRILSASSDGNCASSANYDEIKERCCPRGLVERCRATNTGVILVGRGCDPDYKPE